MAAPSGTPPPTKKKKKKALWTTLRSKAREATGKKPDRWRSVAQAVSTASFSREAMAQETAALYKARLATIAAWNEERQQLERKVNDLGRKVARDRLLMQSHGPTTAEEKKRAVALEMSRHANSHDQLINFSRLAVGDALLVHLHRTKQHHPAAVVAPPDGTTVRVRLLESGKELEAHWTETHIPTRVRRALGLANYALVAKRTRQLYHRARKALDEQRKAQESHKVALNTVYRTAQVSVLSAQELLRSPPRLLWQPAAKAEQIVALSCGRGFAAAVTSAGHLFTWGDNSCGQLGQEQEIGGTFPPRQVALGTAEERSGGADGRLHAARVSCGHSSTAVITACHKLFTMGNGAMGCLGHSTEAHEPRPRLVQVAPRARHDLVQMLGGGASAASVASGSQFFGLAEATEANAANAMVCLSVCPSVRLSVCPSVSLPVTQSARSRAPHPLSCRCRRLRPWLARAHTPLRPSVSLPPCPSPPLCDTFGAVGDWRCRRPAACLGP